MMTSEYGGVPNCTLTVTGGPAAAEKVMATLSSSAVVRVLTLGMAILASWLQGYEAWFTGCPGASET